MASRQKKPRALFVTLVFGTWTVAVIVLGGILTSYHQALRTPGEGILALASTPSTPGWRAIHVLSGSCGCSQRVMRHLVSRPKFDGVTEQVVLVDDQEPLLPGSSELISQLKVRGFLPKRVAVRDIPPSVGLRGVPLLVIASPEDRIAYIGGYGDHSDQDVSIMQKVRSGASASPLPIVGCAVGRSLRRSVDPFHLKYTREN